MKIISTESLAIPDVKTIRFARFRDDRGYFTEHFRESDFQKLEFLTGRIVQAGESFSKKNVARGQHFQTGMGKLVRVLQGRMIDLIVDVRKDSPTFGKRIAYEMKAPKEDYDEWIWIPPGFAHGNLFTEDTRIEYLFTAEHNPTAEGGVSPLAEDLDDSLIEAELLAEVHTFLESAILSEKDKSGTLKDL